jgi:CheY-like chemotaxis protein
VRILHVENNPTAAKGVELMLHGMADEYEATALGEYAVHLAKRTAYDLILLDIMLPDIDGYEVIERLRAAGVRTPYLILSGLVRTGPRPRRLSRQAIYQGRASGLHKSRVRAFESDRTG